MADRIEDVPASVIAVLSRTHIRILLLPGYGLADGGVPCDIPIDMVPLDLRLPNTLLTATMVNGNITSVCRRDDRL